MTDELTKTFFDTFRIEAKTIIVPRYSLNMEYYEEKVEKYPQITDHILLGLICILGNTNYFLITDEGSPIDIDGLKKSVLHSLTLQVRFNQNKYLKQQVRALFKKE